MSNDVKLIIISRYPNTEYLSYIENLGLPGSPGVVIKPNDDTYETTLIINELDGSKFNLIIYDWCYTYNSKVNINANIDSVLAYMGINTTDVAYLSKYLDTCNNYSVSQNITNGDIKFSVVSGTDPVGFNAVLLSGTFAATKLKPKLETGKYYSIAYAINSLKIDEPIKEVAVSPNLFVYNPLYNSIDTSKTYNVKTTECQGITSQIEPPSDNNLLIFYIFLIIIGVCLIIWILLNFTSFGINIEKYKGWSPFKN